jgi:hypothetical protein
MPDFPRLITLSRPDPVFAEDRPLKPRSNAIDALARSTDFKPPLFTGIRDAANIRFVLSWLAQLPTQSARRAIGKFAVANHRWICVRGLSDFNLIRAHGS